MLAGAAGAAPAWAQEVAQSGAATEAPQDVADATAQSSNDIVVTGTRRSVSLQDVPINISAISEAALEQNRLDDVADIAAFTPGLTVADTGPRTANSVVLRGITSGGPGGSNGNFGAGGANAVGIYLGEIPLYVDFKFLDLARVETLLGPQGTLYGLGTLAGAVRYIPNRPNMDRYEGEAHVRYYDVAHSSGPGLQADATLNIPIIRDYMAFRSVVGYYDDPGFIDYPLLVQRQGVSLPQPNFADPAAVRANLFRRKDLNNERTFTTRNQLAIDAGWFRPTFTYIHQKTSTDGSQANGAFGGLGADGTGCAYAGCRGVLGTGRYENPSRIAEPARRTLDLVAAELEIDLGSFAQIVSATAYSDQKLSSTADVTDLLLDLDYDYELFPAFAGTTNAESDLEQFNQELRIISTHGGPFKWLVGGFYNRLTTYTFSDERLPGYPEFAGVFRPDGLEYISFVDSKTREYAFFGEGTFQITPRFQVTGGARYYNYNAQITGGTDTPLTGGGRRRTPFPLIRFDPSRIRSGETGADGFVYKANASYEFSQSLFAYATYSTGYRIGGANRVAPCLQPLPPGQNVCALPNELFYRPDRTRNYEVGLRYRLLDGALSGTVNVYRIDWSDLQVASQTINGAVGIRTNASSARNQGVEAATAIRFGGLTLSGNYTYLDAKLREDAALLIDGEFDAFDGDRLPGTSKHAGSASANYTIPVNGDDNINLLWTTQARSKILSKTGLRGFGENLPGYSTSRASVTYTADRFEVSVFANNVFDKYAISSVANDYSKVAVNDGVISRFYRYGVIQPRVIGAEFRLRLR